MEFESIDVANHVLSLENHFLNNKKVTVENHKNSYNNTLKLCNMESGKGQKKGKNFSPANREASQSNEVEGWDEHDWEAAEENHSMHAKVNDRTKHSTSASKWAEAPRTKHQLMVEDEADDHEYSESRLNEEAEEDEDDDDFNLGLLVPKSFDHDPEVWEQSPMNNVSSKCADTEFDLHEQEFDAQQNAPFWKKQVKPCVAESQASITRKQEIPLMHHSSAVEARIGNKKNQRLSSDPVTFPIGQSRRVESGPQAQPRPESCRQPPAATDRAPTLPSGYAGSASSASRLVQSVQVGRPQTHRGSFAPQCRDYTSLETLALKSMKLPVHGSRPTFESTTAGATGISASKGEGRPFMLCTGLIDERVSNYRFNTLRRRVGRFH